MIFFCFCSWDLFALCLWSAFVSAPPSLGTLAFVSTFQLSVKSFQAVCPFLQMHTNWLWRSFGSLLQKFKYLWVCIILKNCHRLFYFTKNLALGVEFGLLASAQNTIIAISSRASVLDQPGLLTL